MNALDPPADADELERALGALCDQVLGRMEGGDAEMNAILESERIVSAMRHTLLSGGKRLRPALCFAGYLFAKGASGPTGAKGASGPTGAKGASGPTADSNDDKWWRAAMPAACAVEMLHAASLMLDDLPCMDDDDVRRGRPSAHRVYGEPVTILAAMTLVARAAGALVDDAIEKAATCDMADLLRLTRVMRELLRAGERLALGQAGDLLHTRKSPGDHPPSLISDEVKLVERIHAGKTGALIAAAVVSGALLGGASDADLDRVAKFGTALGLAFQIADDVLDVTHNGAQMGKRCHKDAAMGKRTYVQAVGVDASRARAIDLLRDGRRALLGGRDVGDDEDIKDIKDIPLHAQSLLRIARMVENTLAVCEVSADVSADAT